jgi:predicted O-methyltransferase YrrM
MKWLLQNLQNRSVFAAKNPRYTARVLLAELAQTDEKFLALVTGASVKQIRSYFDEPITTPAFARHFQEAGREFRKLKSPGSDLYAKKGLLQYAAVRALKPDTVVETGIANGVSSCYLLLALHKNNKGQLHSVGLSDPQYLPEGRQAGWLVPDWLGGRWNIYRGDSREILPRLLPQVRPLDIFIHDSLHSYEHMYWEFKTAYPHLRPGKLLLADDAVWNQAFTDFSRSIGAQHARILRAVGVLRKNAA